ncbi:MAG: putative ABC-type transport system, ATPase component [Candidatus Uhrbacteria bacterium GW2011_GWA2_52_8d]|uniref:Putative ABC-type transport system, ATPase component n=1 Tax=Candidatus Uhrbacteria bacterium GW2011_GWA2_52_8d TaxID=1618979 RepID=A0A0G1ZX99_9BACT|nr:MAG: putative ABC-type transport system, ATPase component [Candidatus Uhrbacteria bacterium GW2011_GWA2_52_8d]
MAVPLITCKDLTRDYVNGEVVTQALRGVTFEIQLGEFVAIMGPSGSGKSTLMHILGFLDSFTGGTYLFEGKDVREFSGDAVAKFRQDKVGFIFQAFNLLSKSTVYQNILLPLIYGSLSVKERTQRTEDAIKAVSMEHRRDHYSSQLSGGEKQRVAIARALVNEPSVIFADEPTGNLDTKTGAQILDLLGALHDEGHTIVMVTHEAEAAQYASRIIRMRDGVIESDSTNGDRRRGGYNK